MDQKKSWPLVCGAILMGFGIIIGAVGAHALKSNFSAYTEEVFHLGVQYHFFHALGLIALGILMRVDSTFSKKGGTAIAIFFLVGTLLFSGSLYTIAIADNTAFGKITPFGGTSLIIGWFLFAYYLIKKN